MKTRFAVKWIDDKGANCARRFAYLADAIDYARLLANMVYGNQIMICKED